MLYCTEWPFENETIDMWRQKYYVIEFLNKFSCRDSSGGAVEFQSAVFVLIRDTSPLQECSGSVIPYSSSRPDWWVTLPREVHNRFCRKYTKNVERKTIFMFKINKKNLNGKLNLFLNLLKTWTVKMKMRFRIGFFDIYFLNNSKSISRMILKQTTIYSL